MNEHRFRAMNTEWYLATMGGSRDALLAAERIAHDAERRLSRFRAGSAFSRLNDGRALRDRELAAVLRLALRFRRSTRGAFDPAVGGALIAAGYDRSFEQIDRGGTDTATAVAAVAAAPDPRRPEILVDGDRVRLIGEGRIDLGGIVKGWAVDRVARRLAGDGASAVLADGGGDLRALGTLPACGAADDTPGWPVAVGDGLTLRLAGGAVATSSGSRRRWRTASGEAHHIVSPEGGWSAPVRVRTATVVADDATTRRPRTCWPRR